MPIYPAKLQFVALGVSEMVRCLIGSGNGDSASWFLRRLSDRELSEQRRRTVGALLVSMPVPLAHDGLLTYVDDYARARAADSEDRVEVALDYYQRALESLPRNHGGLRVRSW